MAYYPHPEGGTTRNPQTQPGVRERAQVRWWHTRGGVASMVALVALVALVTGGLLQLSHTAQAWWLAERTVALEHAMEVQTHGRSAELELQKQRVAFHLGYVGMAMDRSRSDGERLAVLRLLDGFDGDPDVRRWAHTELAETEARLAAGLGRPGVPDLASAQIDPVGLPGTDGADVELDSVDAADEAPAETVDTALAAPQLGPSLVTEAEGAAQVGVLSPRVARPEEASAAAVVAAPTPDPPTIAPSPVAPAAAPTPVTPPPAAEPVPSPARSAPANDRSSSAERQPRTRPPASTVVTGADRRTRCASGSVRTLRRIGVNGPTCGRGPGAGQQALVTGARVDWISYGDPSDKSSFVECSCSVDD